MDRDLRCALRESLPCAQVEGDARPTPVVNLKACGNEGLRLRCRVHSRLATVACDLCCADPAWAVLAAHHLAADLLRADEAHGTQHLHLLVAQCFCVKGCWWLHRNEGEELEEVILQNVAECTGLFVEGATALHAERLCHGDLDVVDIAAMPDRLENQVAETENQDVAHRLFP